MEPALEYDPAVNRATLTPAGENWYLWLERPDPAPGVPHLMTRNDVGDAIGDYRLGEPETVIGYFERCLIKVGYSTTREDGRSSEAWIAAWALAPGQN
jgi:hypothetical protein